MYIGIFSREMQEDEDLRADNRLRRSHLDFLKIKMKVSLAVPTIISSTADAIEFCNKILNLPQFEDSSETVMFIRCIGRLFDFLNLRIPFLHKRFRAPLQASNEVFW